MAQDNLIDLKKPEASVKDPITDISCQGTRQILTAELEAEMQGFLRQYQELIDVKGCQRVVRTLLKV